MTNPITGLIHITGEIDSGKTTLAYTAAQDPKKIAFFDDDLKGERVDRILHFGVYHNLVREFAEQAKQKPIDFHNYVIGKLKELPANKFDVLVYDNWSRMEDGIRDYSESKMGDISSLTHGQIEKISQLTWNYTYTYYAQILDLMLTKAPLVILTTHIKEKYKSPGVYQARGQRPLIEKSSLRIWTRHNADVKDRGAPIGLVLKRVDVPKTTKQGIQVLSVLPRRVKPCTWVKINEYFESPIGLREPTQDELPNAFELSILDGVLTRDQFDALKLALAMPDEPSLELRPDRSSEVRELATAGKSRVAIAKELKLTLSQVSKCLANGDH